MSLNQEEIQELFELFPNSKAAIERFGNASAANEALDKLDQKISQLKEELASLKVKKAKKREEFNTKIDNLFQIANPFDFVNPTEYYISYSRVDIFLAENSLSQLKAEDLVDNQDNLVYSRQETKDILLNAWLENYNDREIKALESSILDLQTLVTQLTA